jgi:protoporphyrinogen/coproporphyrinogen III oxidase
VKTPHIVVIGGGFSGVSAAHHLLRTGHLVTLIDASRTLGGRARSDTLDGLVIDTGAQLAASSFTHALHLFGQTAAGVPGGFHRTPGRDAIMRRDRTLDIQFGSLRSLLTFGGISATEKLRLGRQLLPLLARHRAHLSADGERIPLALDRESAGDFISRRVGADASTLLAETTVNAFYAASGNEVSLAFLLTLGRYGSDSDMLAPAAGWSAMLERCIIGAKLRLGVRATALSVHDDRATVTMSGLGEIDADAVVLAAGPRVAADLLESSGLGADALARWLRGMPLRPTLTLALGVDGTLDRRRFGLFRAADEATFVSAAAIHGAKVQHLAERDVVLAWPTPQSAPTLMDAASETVVDAMLPEIEHLLPGLRNRVTRARIYRFAEGSPLPVPGFAADRAEGRRLAAGLPRHLALAGDFLSMPLIESAAISGERAATRVQQALARS